MPKKAKELTAIEVKRLIKEGRHAVGFISGLLLVVKDTGAKSWVIRTMVGGKRKSIGLGPYPEISLSVAREKARAVKSLIEKGIDPIKERQARQAALKKKSMQTISFSDAAIECHKKKEMEFKNQRHISQWISSINRYAGPIIGDIPISEIDLPEILAVLKPIWTEKTETATRLRQRLEAVLSWAEVAGYRTGDNPARWKNNLEHLLPKPSKIKKKNHFKALPWKDIAAFMVELRKRTAMTARALEWIILTACRSGEVRGATWMKLIWKIKFGLFLPKE